MTRIDVGRSFNLLVVHRDVTDAERSARALRVLSRRLIRRQERSGAGSLASFTIRPRRTSPRSASRWRRIELASPPGDTTMPALLSESRELAQRTVAQLRTLSYLLHPPLLDDEGLVSALRWYASGFARRSDIRTVLRVSRGFGRVPRDVETALFAVVQECLTNVYRHSTSDRVSIRLRRDDERVTVAVSDQGRELRRTPGGTAKAAGPRHPQHPGAAARRRRDLRAPPRREGPHRDRHRPASPEEPSICASSSPMITRSSCRDSASCSARARTGRCAARRGAGAGPSISPAS